MLNYIKTSLSLSNKYIILAMPLILFLLLSSLYILFSVNGNMISLSVAVILYTLMLAAFMSGWFGMITNCIKMPDDNDPNQLLKEFPAGVGEYFVSTIVLIINIFILSIVFIILAYIAGMKLIGDIGISADSLSQAMVSATALKTFLLTLSTEQLLKLNAWNLLLLFAMAFMYFIIMFYPPAMYFKQKNPYKALYVALKDLFSRNFFKNLLLFIILFISYSFLSILTTIASINVISHFIFTLINFYYLVFVAILVFEFYYSNYVKIGSQIDTKI